MISQLKIALIILFIIPIYVVGQNTYCLQQFRSLKAYDDHDYLKAKVLMDSALTVCSDAKNNSYVWHAMGFICKAIFKTVDNKSSDSKAREWAINAFKKSMFLDSVDKKYDSLNKPALKTIALTYYNDCARHMDTNNYDDAIKFFNKYKETYYFAYPDKDLTQAEIVFNNTLAGVYKEKYENNPKKYESFIKLSIKTYEHVLKLDSLNYSAYHNLGIIWHNLGVELILTELDVEEDLLLMMDFLDRSVECFTKALPYLKKAYELDPHNLIIVRGMAAIYYSLHEEEKHMIFMNLLNDLQNKSDD